MGIGLILVVIVFVFAINYFAVKLAIIPLLDKSDENITDKQECGLVKLRDMDILSNTELEYVIKLYKNKYGKDGENEQYKKYAKVLNELKEIEYFTHEEYCRRIGKLKKYFKIS